MSALVAAATPAENGEAVRSAPPPAPPLPDDAAISTAAGGALTRDPHASPHPAALPGGSALYRSPGGERAVLLAWVPAVAIDVYRALPPASQRLVPGVGDEAYHARAAGALMARRAGDVLMVTVHAPDLDATARDDLAARVATVALGTEGATERTGTRVPGGTTTTTDQ